MKKMLLPMIRFNFLTIMFSVLCLSSLSIIEPNIALFSWINARGILLYRGTPSLSHNPQ